MKIQIRAQESRVTLEKELDMAKASPHAIEEKNEDTALMKLPELEEDAEQRVESYIQTLPIKTTVSDIQSPAAVVPKPIFSTRLSTVVPDVCSSGFGLNPNAPKFVPSSSVTRLLGFQGCLRAL